ncbi:MAG: Curli production assembly/transport component CsgG [Flavobacteriaceae bacterium]|nr:Curli production assembly/transport component CsgG [Flavobacteriaceae bacterium]
MSKTFFVRLLFISCCLGFYNSIIAQQAGNKEINKDGEYEFAEEIRDKNAVSVALGASLINGDYPNGMYEFYGHVGYKRFLNPYTNINFGFNKFSLANDNDVFKEGFMSFDLNLEFYLLPYSKFTPFVFAGGGLNASDDFGRTDTKAQGGVGIELLPNGSVGFKLFAEFNQVFSDELDNNISGKANDGFLRLAFGINFYFGELNKRLKTKDDVPTIINTNPIKDNKN